MQLARRPVLLLARDADTYDMDTFHIHNGDRLIIRPDVFSVLTDDRPDSPRRGAVDFHMPLSEKDAEQLMRLLADRFPQRYATHVKEYRQ